MLPMQLLAQLSGDSAIRSLVYLIVVGLIFWAIWWFLAYVAIPEPFNKVVRVILALVALLIIINVLLGLIGHPLIRFP